MSSTAVPVSEPPPPPCGGTSSLSKDDGAPPPETPQPEAPRQRADYLRWSCDQLAALLRGQWERKARIESKIGAVVAVLNVFAGFVLIPRSGVANNPTLAGAILAVRIGSLVALSVVLVLWFLAIRVGDVENLNARAFTDDDGHPTSGADYAFRYNRVRDNLTDALAKSVPLIERRAAWIRRCEVASVLAYLLLFVLVLLEVVKS